MMEKSEEIYYERVFVFNESMYVNSFYLVYRSRCPQLAVLEKVF